MVYSGRPSTGCARCRERRKKCDETRPACMNCVKLGRECPGFPDQLDLMFKNETATVERKATRGSRPGGSKRGTLPKPSSSSIASERSSTDAGPSRRMSVRSEVSLAAGVDALDIEQAGTSELSMGNESGLFTDDDSNKSFFHVLALKPYRRVTTPFDINSLIRQPEGGELASPLSLITEAIAIRSIANLPGNSRLITHTNVLYEQSLRGVHGAIESGQAADVEEALNSILLFTLYEFVASCSALYWSLYSATSTNPAASADTAERIGSTRTGLFQTARARMFTDNAMRRTVFDRVSEAERNLKGQSGKSRDRGLADYPIQMADVLDKASGLMLAVGPRTLDTVQQVEGLLQDAYDLQNELYRWDMNMPPQFGYKSVVETDAAEDSGVLAGLDAWPGAVQVYGSVHIASIRNNNRVSQLLCSNVVMEALRWLEPGSYAEDRRYLAAGYRVQYLVDDITASVPFHYGYGSAGESGAATAQAGAIRRNGYFLVWPLYVASQMTSIPRPQRGWLIRRLDAILQQYGLERSDDNL